MGLDVVKSLLLAKGAKTSMAIGTEEIPFDVASAVTHEFSSEVTSFAVEDGSTVQDHIVTAPEEVEVEGITTDHPVEILAVTRSILSGGLNAEPRSATAFKLLKKAWSTKQLLTIVTSRETYSDMALVSLTIPHEPEESLHFTIRARKVRKVKLLIGVASLTDRVAGAADQGSGEANRSLQPGQSPTAGEQSAGDDLAGGLGL